MNLYVLFYSFRYYEEQYYGELSFLISKSSRRKSGQIFRFRHLCSENPVISRFSKKTRYCIFLWICSTSLRNKLEAFLKRHIAPSCLCLYIESGMLYLPNRGVSHCLLPCDIFEKTDRLRQGQKEPLDAARLCPCRLFENKSEFFYRSRLLLLLVHCDESLFYHHYRKHQQNSRYYCEGVVGVGTCYG